MDRQLALRTVSRFQHSEKIQFIGWSLGIFPVLFHHSVLSRERLFLKDPFLTDYPKLSLTKPVRSPSGFPVRAHTDEWVDLTSCSGPSPLWPSRNEVPATRGWPSLRKENCSVVIILNNPRPRVVYEELTLVLLGSLFPVSVQLRNKLLKDGVGECRIREREDELSG